MSQLGLRLNDERRAKKIEKDQEAGIAIKRITKGWKVITGFEKDDEGWNKAHWGRTAKTAKKLLDFLGSADNAIDCCQDIKEKMNKLGLCCTIETVLKHSAEWRIKKEQKGE